MVGLGACAVIPPERHVTPQQDVAGAQLATDIHLAREGWPQARWWTAYGDVQLEQLIDAALKDSPTLESAAARIGAAQAALVQNQAARDIGVNFQAAANRQRYSANGLFPSPIGGSTYTEETLGIQARYDFDWWGRNRARIAAAAGEANARRADYAQAELILAAAIAQSYFRLQGDWALAVDLRRMEALQRDMIKDTVRRIERGLAIIDEQRTDETRLSELQRQIAQIDADAVREREGLRALLGAGSDALRDLRPHPAATTAAPLPRRLGLELLARRPDLQAARWRVQAALSRVELAETAFYPDINLTGSFGLDSISISNLLSAGSRTFYLGPTLSLPLFNGKSLQGQLGQARSARNEVIADYNQSVFDAVREVAQAGAEIQGLDTELGRQDDAVRSSNAVLKSVQARLKQGLTDHGALLRAEMTSLNQADVIVQLRTRRQLAEVALMKALGGGYHANQEGRNIDGAKVSVTKQP
ncbi:efflux transporter outer membrane subunit [Noviherbaspirillum pedocola]|uniref:efflux transporter outer membrane subunit n=1 Tax=Noviherbaspirillum pedocola TaxID=2801341 RepID=UPI001F414DD8|nr:efflux transporter outer membrane subunit [Noviherbaspirillum pedocola]